MSEKPESKSDCVVPPAIPIEAISDYVLEHSAERARDVIEYVEGQARGEKVSHCEHVKTEFAYSDRYDVWDVHTDKNRWWVITNLTNLYRQSDFSSLDYTLSFHIGLMARLNAREGKNHSKGEVDFAELSRKIDQISERLEESDEAEDFQNVGMLCREALVLLSRSLAESSKGFAEGNLKQADFKNWSEVAANNLAAGSSAASARSLMKHTAKRAWDHVAWLTHAGNATKYDAFVAYMSTMMVIDTFLIMLRKHRSGIPETCPQCNSYNVASFYRPEFETETGYIKACEKCGWNDEPSSE